MEATLADQLKVKTLDIVEDSYSMLKKSFEIFNKKWAAQQSNGPLDKKEMDELIVEALNDGIEKIKTAKK